MILRELRDAWGAMSARPLYSALVVGVLAIGLGCVLFVAGMINGLMIEPLPYAEPDRLYAVGLIEPDHPDDVDAHRLDPPDASELVEWRDRLDGIALVAGSSSRTINLSDGERPERFDGAAVTANLFPTLGVAPILGSGFLPEHEQPGASPVVMLSHDVWQRRFGADPAIVGRTIRVNAQPATVVGVMPPRFTYPYRERVWTAATLQRGRGGDDLAAVLRLLPGVAEARMQSALDQWFEEARVQRAEEMRSRARAVGIQPLAYRIVNGTTRTLFWVMAVAVGLVLVIACANATNLVLTQTVARRQELWLRAALGATRRRIALLLLAQTGLLATIAVAIAVPLAQLLLRLTLASFEGSSDDGPPPWMDFDFDARMLGFALLAASLVAVLTAVMPALRASAPGVGGAGTRVHSGPGLARASRWLVTGEVALSCALLMGAAVMVQAVTRLDRFDLGLDTSRVLSARIALFEARYPTQEEADGYARRLRERIALDPEVESVSFSSSLPGLMGENVDVLERGRPEPESGMPDAGHSHVDAGFLATMRPQLVQGRFIEAADIDNAHPVMVVDEVFAQRHAPEGNVIGRRFQLDGAGSGPREASVVGVVRAVQMDDIDDPIEPSVFEPMHQTPRFVSLLIRTRGAPRDYADGLLRAIAEVDPDTPAYWVRDYTQVLNEATVGVRMLGRVFSGFGLVALALAAAGLYGVVAFTVAQRTREIGVLRALGAPDTRVLASVGARSLWQVGIGLVLGVALGLPFAQALSSPIPHVVDVETGAWLTVVLVLGCVALLAVWLPARRALRIAPMAALRDE